MLQRRCSRRALADFCVLCCCSVKSGASHVLSRQHWGLGSPMLSHYACLGLASIVSVAYCSFSLCNPQLALVKRGSVVAERYPAVI